MKLINHKNAHQMVTRATIFQLNFIQLADT